MQSRGQEFLNTRLDGQIPPSDIKMLLGELDKPKSFITSALDVIFKRNATTEDSMNLISSIGADFLWPDTKYSLLDHDYLNEQDRANPDTMANIKAMQDTDKKLRFVLEYKDDSLLGYWQPDPSTALDKCILFWLNTEGQYDIAEGSSAAETLAYRALLDGNKNLYEEVLRTFKQFGITILQRDEETIFAEMNERQKKLDHTPEQYRFHRYENYRSKAYRS